MMLKPGFCLRSPSARMTRLNGCRFTKRLIHKKTETTRVGYKTVTYTLLLLLFVIRPPWFIHGGSSRLPLECRLFLTILNSFCSDNSEKETQYWCSSSNRPGRFRHNYFKGDVVLLRRSCVVVLVHFLKRKKMLNKTVIGYDIYFLQSDYNHFVNTSRRPWCLIVFIRGNMSTAS